MKKIIVYLLILIPLISLSQDTITGRATYYHDMFEGRKTATGEVFRQSKLTAASNIFKMGSIVKVINVSNGKWVILRINDTSAKWTLKKGRVIDLSKKAARMLCMDQLQKVKIVLIN